MQTHTTTYILCHLCVCVCVCLKLARNQGNMQHATWCVWRPFTWPLLGLPDARDLIKRNMGHVSARTHPHAHVYVNTSTRTLLSRCNNV